MENTKEIIALTILIFGLLLFFTATDPYVGKTELIGEKTIFEYKYSEIDPIIHKIFVDIKAEKPIEAEITKETLTGDKETYEYKGEEINFVKPGHKGEKWTLTIENKNPEKTKVEYDARITCYSYTYGGIILTALGFFTLIWEKTKRRRTE